MFFFDTKVDKGSIETSSGCYSERFNADQILCNPLYQGDLAVTTEALTFRSITALALHNKNTRHLN